MIYRTNAQPVGKRWGATFWKKWYVRIARIFFSVREPYVEQRQFNQWVRNRSRRLTSAGINKEFIAELEIKPLNKPAKKVHG